MNGLIKLTGDLDVAVGIVNEVSLSNFGGKGRNGCKRNSEERETLIVHG